MTFNWLVFFGICVTFTSSVRADPSVGSDGISTTIERSISEQDNQAGDLATRMKIRNLAIETPAEPAPPTVEIDPIPTPSN